MGNNRFKFRIWDGNRYIQYRPCIDQEPFVFDMTDVIGENYPKNLDGCTIEQCTGLRDKNGKLIYEGDVIEENGFRKYIYWHKNGWVYSMNGTNKTINWQLKEDDAAFSEIIGNIHETKENT